MKKGKIHKTKLLKFFKGLVCGISLEDYPNVKRTIRWSKVTCLHCLMAQKKK